MSQVFSIQPGIYGIKNTTTGKWYIGQSVDLYHRQASHLSHLRNGSHSNSHLQSAWSKYGEESMEWHVVEIANEDMLDVLEKKWIEYYHSTNPEFGYNIEGGGCAGHSVSVETREKLADINTGKKQSPETVLKRISKTRGMKRTDEVRQAQSARMMGNKRSLGHRRTISPEHKEKIRLWHLGRKQSEETIQKRIAKTLGQKRSDEFRAACSARMIGNNRGHRKQSI